LTGAACAGAAIAINKANDNKQETGRASMGKYSS
jgi:hypothetical protein